MPSVRPVDQEAARKLAFDQLDVLRKYAANDQSRLLMQMLDTMVAYYQAQLIDCAEADITPQRVAARQLRLLRKALSSDDPARSSLFV